MAVSGVAQPQGRRPAAVFYPLGYPTPYASASFFAPFGFHSYQSLITFNYFGQRPFKGQQQLNIDHRKLLILLVS
jgi:hypothetical protein